MPRFLVAAVFVGVLRVFEVAAIVLDFAEPRFGVLDDAVRVGDFDAVLDFKVMAFVDLPFDKLPDRPDPVERAFDLETPDDAEFLDLDEDDVDFEGFIELPDFADLLVTDFPDREEVIDILDPDAFFGDDFFGDEPDLVPADFFDADEDFDPEDFFLGDEDLEPEDLLVAAMFLFPRIILFIRNIEQFKKLELHSNRLQIYQLRVQLFVCVNTRNFNTETNFDL